MAKNIATLGIELTTNVARIQKDMREVKGHVGRAMGDVTTSINAAKSALGYLGLGLSGAAFVGFIKSSINANDALSKLSEATGTSVENLAGLKFAAEQNGTSLDFVAKAGQKMSQQLAQNPELFRKIGITATDSTGALVQIADVFADMPDGVEKSALSIKLFGDDLGAKLIPFLNQGTESLGRYIEQGKRYNPVTKESAYQSAQFNDNLDAFTASASGTGVMLANELLPGLLSISAALKDSADGDGYLKKFIGGLKLLGISVAETAQKVALATEIMTSPSDWFDDDAMAKAEAKFKAFGDLAEQERIRIAGEMAGVFEPKQPSRAPINDPKSGKAGVGLLGDLGGGEAKKATAQATRQKQADEELARQTHLILQKQAIIQQGADDQLAIETEAVLRRYALQEASNDQLSALLLEGELSKRNIEELSARQRIGTGLKTFDTLLAGAGQHSRAMFNLNKVSAIAQGILSMRESISTAYAAGSRIGGPIVGAGFAATAGIAQLLNLNAIKNAKFGGGGAGAAATGGGVSSGLPGQTANPNTVGYAPPPTSARAVPSMNFYFNGNVLSADFIEEHVKPVVPDAVKEYIDTDGLIIDSRSRQASVIAEMAA